MLDLGSVSSDRPYCSGAVWSASAQGSWNACKLLKEEVKIKGGPAVTHENFPRHGPRIFAVGCMICEPHPTLALSLSRMKAR